MNVNTFLANQRKHFRLKGLYSTRNRRRAPKQEYRWLLRSATSAKQLAEHRAAIEHDCFTSVAHQKLLREAAREYDAMLEREKKPAGRPRTRGGRKGIYIPKSTRAT